MNLARLPNKKWPSDRGLNGEIADFWRALREIGPQGIHNQESRIQRIAACRSLWRALCRTGQRHRWYEITRRDSTYKDFLRIPGPEDEELDPESSLWAIAQMETVEAQFTYPEGTCLSLDLDWSGKRDFNYTFTLSGYLAEALDATMWGGGFWYHREFGIPESDIKAGGRRACTWFRAAIKSMRIQIHEEWGDIYRE